MRTFALKQKPKRKHSHSTIVDTTKIVSMTWMICSMIMNFVQSQSERTDINETEENSLMKTLDTLSYIDWSAGSTEQHLKTQPKWLATCKVVNRYTRGRSKW